MIKDRFFKYGLAVIMVLVIIFLFGEIDFFIEPFKKFIAILFFPILLAGVLYYMLRPLVGLLERLRVPRTLAILIMFVVLIILIMLVSTYAGSLINKQINQFINDFPAIMQVAEEKIGELLYNNNISADFSDKVSQQLTTALENVVPFVSNSILGVLAALASVFTVLLVVPFILFYLLKDQHKFYALFLNAIPQRYRKHVSDIAQDVDKTLSTYIIGQAILAAILGVLMFIGYLAIGLKYSLILALFAMVTSFIPMFGSAIGIIPALIVSLSYNPFMAVKVLIIMVIVQALEGNLISPLLVGKRLEIHPLTLIILFLAAASLYGFIGMLVAVPAYAVLKVIVTNVTRIYREAKEE